ncbi:hypothetical protein [Micromonospora cathayae]|uniref:Uncharacterized protein n=1 Tax=Micromonospora cathayae TaxID=3028804 RepID=A0ABY7ZSW8_9ACTN|nr:hypothetical protein [Micromonospora sp. HUAS 3]WDZ85995.1 hypothetical protein PVK37_06095 [Micromonospora sp. HUAS 3]
MGVHESRARAESRAAHEIIAAHVADQEPGICRVCLAPGPCAPANAAANRLVELGLPVRTPVLTAGRLAVLRHWLAPHRWGSPRPAPLVTRAWRWRLGSATG